MSEILVTVSLASYNNAKYIIDTLTSIYNQSYDNIELVIIDDYSTDNSNEVVDKWIEANSDRFSNVVFIKNEKNKGVCKVANQMIKNASGKYVSLMASDDLMMPDKIKIQVEILENTAEDVGAVYSDATMIKDDGSRSYGWYIQWYRNDFEDIPSGELFEVQMNGGFIPSMAVLTKMECFKKVGPFDEELSYEDYDMWLRIARNYKILFSDYASVIYRRRSGSLRSAIKNWTPAYLKIYLKHLDYHPYALRNVRDNARNAYTNGDDESYKILITSAAKNDRFVKTAIRLMKYKIPLIIGLKILDRVRKTCVSGT